MIVRCGTCWTAFLISNGRLKRIGGVRLSIRLEGILRLMGGWKRRKTALQRLIVRKCHGIMLADWRDTRTCDWYYIVAELAIGCDVSVCIGHIIHGCFLAIHRKTRFRHLCEAI